MKVEKFSNREDRPEPPEPSAPKTDVTDEEVAVETDMVEGSTLREALEAQVENDGEVYAHIYGEINRLEEENNELREAVAELTEAVEFLAAKQGKLAGNNRPTVRLVEDKVIRE
jgi:hypothetical protein